MHASDARFPPTKELKGRPMHPLMCRSLAPIVAVAVALGNAPARGEVTAYPIPKGMEPSPDYQLTAGGKGIFVYKTPAFSMATFATTGETDVEVKVQRPVTREGNPARGRSR